MCKHTNRHDCIQMLPLTIDRNPRVVEPVRRVPYSKTRVAVVARMRCIESAHSTRFVLTTAIDS